MKNKYMLAKSSINPKIGIYLKHWKPYRKQKKINYETHFSTNQILKKGEVKKNQLKN
jgi:hypothetical protein